MFADSGKLILPCVIGLNCLDINCAGDGQELSNLCQKVTELDLSHNNISDWTEVCESPNVLFVIISFLYLHNTSYH